LAGFADAMAKESASAENTTTQSTQAPSNGRVVYTIEGKKDPRLQATFMATYISTSKSEACSYQNPATATRKVKIGSKNYPITEENYRIEIPVYLEENENECGYRFSRIELVLRRQYDKELYSRHILLDRTPKAHAIYRGEKTGFGGKATLTMPAQITTGKHYFRIARQTQYICRTKNFIRLNRHTFYCFMQIRDGKGENQFIPTNKQQTVVTHPEFGVDEISSDTLQVDIMADDLGSKAYTGKEILQDHFRTLSKPPPPTLSMGERLKQWLDGLFE
jgi:hypothetical protein